MEHCDHYLEYMGDHSAFCDLDKDNPQGSCGTPGDECTIHTKNPFFGTLAPYSKLLELLELQSCWIVNVLRCGRRHPAI